MPIIPVQAHLEDKLRGRIPLVIGVTGHMDLARDDAKTDALRREIAAVFRRLRRDYLAGDDETPIVLLSALAEGADRLVADVALEPEHGLILIAPLPMEEAEYRRDFRGAGAQSPNAEQEFDALLGRAFAKFDLPYRAGNTRDLVAAEEDRRAAQYQDVGIYTLRHCHVLIALWNGDTAEKTGGTSQILRFKRQGIPFELAGNARAALDGSEIGPVIEIMAPRRKAGSPQVGIETRPWGFDLTGAPLDGVRRVLRDSVDFVRILFGRHLEHDKSGPEVEAWNTFRALMGQTRRFNREAAALDASDRDKVENSLAYLFTDRAAASAAELRTETAPLPQPKDVRPVHLPGVQARALDVAARWCALYKLADAVALARQREFRRDWLWLFSAAFIAILFFEIYAHLFGSWFPLVLYIATLGFAFSLFIRARVRHHQERFLDYRALAEALRVAVYWKLARIENPVVDAHPIKQPSELAWVKIVVSILDMFDDAIGKPLTPADRQSLDEVRRLWVVGQWSYFSGKSRQLNLRAETREEWSLVALAASPIIGALGLAWLYYWPDEHHRHYMIVIMGSLVGLGAVVAGYTEQLAFKAQGRQYDRMHALFARALLLINKALNAHPAAITPDDIAQIKSLYVELGSEAMKEHAEWVAIYRQRPIRPAG